MTTSRTFRASLAVALAVIVAAPVVADWLVTREGDRVETDGPWKVDGRRVIFNLADGTLSMMRLTEVDLPASEAATEAALNPPPAEPADTESEADPVPVLVLTNADIPSGEVAAPAVQGEAATADTTNDSELRVVRWRRSEDEDGGVELHGTVRNLSRNLAADVRITATVRDAEGEVVGTGNAFLDATSLVAGSSTGFRVLFDGVYDFIGEPEWAIQAEMLEVGARGDPTAQGSAADGLQADEDAEPAIAAPAEDDGEGEAEAAEGEGG